MICSKWPVIIIKNIEQKKSTLGSGAARHLGAPKSNIKRGPYLKMKMILNNSMYNASFSTIRQSKPILSILISLNYKTNLKTYILFKHKYYKCIIKYQRGLCKNKQFRYVNIY